MYITDELIYGLPLHWFYTQPPYVVNTSISNSAERVKSTWTGRYDDFYYGGKWFIVILLGNRIY